MSKRQIFSITEQTKGIRIRNLTTWAKNANEARSNFNKGDFAIEQESFKAGNANKCNITSIKSTGILE